MGYNELSYLLVFLPAVLCVFSLSPRRARPAVLTAASWIYFYLNSRILVLYLIGETVFVYGMALAMDRAGERRRVRRSLMLLSVGAVTGVLLYVKYTGFFLAQVNKVRAASGLGQIALPQIAVPVGISFYTLEAVGYLLEVYWKRVPADRDFLRVALLLGFFPQTLEGPVARYTDTAMQFTAACAARQDGRGRITAEDLSGACLRIFWGMFKKLVVADRLNTAVGILYGNFQDYHGAMIAVAAVAYAVQLYMEFSGMMDVVIGSARLFGIRLPENFRQPFFSQTASEFWRRWHITLGVFMKEYVFYPVAASKRAKSLGRKVRKKHGRRAAKLVTSALALTPVWLLNGLWHGPKWNYIFYGIYYLVILMTELALEPAKAFFYRKTGADSGRPLFRALRILRTWLIIFTGELFFRADGVRAGLSMFRSMFDRFSLAQLGGGALLKLGLGSADWAAVIAGTAAVTVYDLMKEKGFSANGWLKARRTWVRWACSYALIFAVIIFGAYGTGYQPVDLIYAGF